MTVPMKRNQVMNKVQVMEMGVVVMRKLLLKLNGQWDMVLVTI